MQDKRSSEALAEGPALSLPKGLSACPATIFSLLYQIAHFSLDIFLPAPPSAPICGLFPWLPSASISVIRRFFSLFPLASIFEIRGFTFSHQPNPWILPLFPSALSADTFTPSPQRPSDLITPFRVAFSTVSDQLQLYAEPQTRTIVVEFADSTQTQTLAQLAGESTYWLEFYPF